MPDLEVDSHVLLTRPPREYFPVRLACVKLLASVHSEPGSNSLILILYWIVDSPVSPLIDKGDT